MRFTASLLALSLAIPALVLADDPDRPSPRRTPGNADGGRDDLLLAQYTPRPAPAPYATRPAPAPYAARPAPAPTAPRGGRRGYRTYAGPGAVAIGVLPFWGGFGFGWGYYPLYPAYPRYAPPSPADGTYDGAYPPPGDGYAGGGYGYPPPEPDRVRVRLGAAVAGMPDGAVGGFNLALDTRTVGFSASVDAISIDDVTRVGDSGGDALGWGSAHLTWSILADAAFRVRLELGGSMLSLPTTGKFAGLEHAGDVAFGPDVGLSGQVGLVGPVGVEGHVRLTPLPYTVVDSRLALALRGGPLAVTLGWRGIRLYEDAGEVPDVDFSGPELGVTIAF